MMIFFSLNFQPHNPRAGGGVGVWGGGGGGGGGGGKITPTPCLKLVGIKLET